MPELDAWLLDLFEDPQDDLVLYFISEDGQRLRLRHTFPVTFYALGQDSDLRALWRFLAAQSPRPSLRRDKRSDVFTRQDETVLAIEVPKSYHQRDLFEKVLKAFPQLSYADADLQLSLRFAAVTGAFPTAYCHICFDEDHNLLKIEAKESAWDLKNSHIPLRVMSLYPDVNPTHAQPQLLKIEVGNDHYQLALQPERPLLVNLRALLLRHDPDLLLTDWGDTWLLPYLIQTAEKNELPLPLNREKRVEVHWQKERTYFSYGQIVYRGQQVHLYGRCHIDRRNAVLWNDYELDGILEACRVTSLPLQVSGRTSPGTGISAIQTLTALREGILVPWQKQQAEMLKPASELFLSDQGGLVYQPKVGVHSDVAEIDFVSLYPAIMVYFNISPETILNDPQAPNLVPTLGIGIDNSKVGLIPKALKPLLVKRVSLKRRLGKMQPWDPQHTVYSRRASALKWLLVTCFGYLGYKNARFGRIEAHQAVTAYGREALLLAKETAEEAGYEVVHLYVDALWVRKKGKKTPEDFEDLLEKIHNCTGLPIALDGVYRWLVFLPSRQNVNRPVPNRYFGVFQDGSLKVRGIDARRHDSPPFVAQTQMHILELLAARKDPGQALPAVIRYLQSRLRQLHAHQIPLEDLLIKQRLGRKLEDYRSLPATARAALQLEQIGKHLRPGQRVIFLYTLEEPGVHAWDLDKQPHPASIDLARYQELLLRAAAMVLQPWMGSEDKLRALVLKKGEQLQLPRMRVQHPAEHRRNIPGIVNPAVQGALQGHAQ